MTAYLALASFIQQNPAIQKNFTSGQRRDLGQIRLVKEILILMELPGTIKLGNNNKDI